MTPAATAVWRPYNDEPVLTPAMTGGHRATPTGELHRLRSYLEAVVDQRRCPVHTAVAFNAAYFGFEDGEGYGKGPFDIDTFPSLTLGDEVPALPVGALVRVRTGSELLYAEIVYKDGQHARLREGVDVPAWISGAPPGVHSPQENPAAVTPVRRELLVPDFTAFGPALQPDEARFDRFCNRQKWLNKDGHVVVDARYTSASPAALDDLNAFVRYLLTDQREALLSPLVPVSVAHLAGSSNAERLRNALLGLLDAVGHALNTSELLRNWGHYALTRRRIGAGLLDAGPLGGADLRVLTGSLERAAIPTGRRRHGLSASRTAYTAIGPWLRGVAGAAPLLTGVDYAVSVCRANLAVADFIRGDTENGRCDASDVRITLDDSFESGGIWRSHHPGAQEPADDPLLPGRRGWRDTVEPPAAQADTTPPPPPAQQEQSDAHPLDNPADEHEHIGAPRYLRINDSEVSWSVPLRLAHLMEDRLPVPPKAQEILTHFGVDFLAVRWELTHPGGDLDDTEKVQEVKLDLTGEIGMFRNIQWPLDFFPGLRLYLQWPRGGRVVRLRTVELDEPVEVDGQVITHEYDAGVLIRDGAPGSGREGDSATGLDVRSLVKRAVRRCGRLTPDGSALLDRVALPRCIYDLPPSPDQNRAVDQAVNALLIDESLHAAVGSRGADGEPHHPARDGEALIDLIRYTPVLVVLPRPRAGGGFRVPARGAQHFVQGFLRRLPTGWEPTDAQRAAYREHCRHVGKADGWQLPAGYTFVTSHSRRR